MSARQSGMGIVVEYANQQQRAQWTPPPRSRWDYTIFGTSRAASRARPDHRHGL